MKNIIFTTLLCLLCAGAYAQNADSLAYQLQRKKINTMLDERTRKFGQYAQSLTQHTGIFGLQTKKDIRRSNDILMDIVKTDDDIYKQLKVLLDMNTFQQKQAVDKSKETEARSHETENYNLRFMNAVNRLRAENDKLNNELKDAERHQELTILRFIIAIAILLLCIFLFVRRKYIRKH